MIVILKERLKRKKKKMKESENDFFDRIFSNAVEDVVLVWEDKRKKGKPAKWTTAQARQYINYLNQK